MPPPILAHLGHWYVSLPVFMGPALLLVLALKIQAWRERGAGLDHGAGLDQSGTRARVTSAVEGSKRIVAVSGPLNYPTLIDIEVELAGTEREVPGPMKPGFSQSELSASEIVLDLRRVSSADEESALALCDVLGQVQVGARVSALVSREPVGSLLRTVFAIEEVATIEEAAVEGQRASQTRSADPER